MTQRWVWLVQTSSLLLRYTHKLWQQQNLRLPKAMQDTATAIDKEKLELGILEYSQGLSQSCYFIV